MKITLKSPEEIEIMAAGGKILSATLKKVLAAVKPEVTTLALDKIAQEHILSLGGKPSFKMEKGYRYTTCMCVNDMVVHGLPTDYRLQNGDVLGVDLGVYFRGFHTDSSWSVVVGRALDNKVQAEKEKFLAVGERALELALAECLVGGHVGDISRMIQETVEGAGYSCVRQLVGHGVGKKLHEDPEVPCYLRGRIENTPLLAAGMVLAVEVIYNQGESQVVYGGDDGWTIVTRDGSLSGLFEHTVAITPAGPRVLTGLSRK